MESLIDKTLEELLVDMRYLSEEDRKSYIARYVQDFAKEFCVPKELLRATA